MAAVKKKRRPWTAKDDALLREHYPHRLTKDVALLLRRTVNTTYVRASQLGLKKSAEVKTGFIEASTKASRPAGVHLNGGKKWTKPAIAKLKKLYPMTPGVEVARILGRRVSHVYSMATKLGLKKDPELIRRMAREAMKRLDHGARGHRFQKGNVPANKGQKGYNPGGRAVLTQFKPGQQPSTTKPIGSLRVDADGMLYVKVADEGYHPTDWRPLQQQVWALKNGPIPPKHMVIFKDGNRRNFADDNLQLMSLADNLRRHSIHNLPPALKEVIHLKGVVKAQITRRRKREQQQHQRAA